LEAAAMSRARKPRGVEPEATPAPDPPAPPDADYQAKMAEAKARLAELEAELAEQEAARAAEERERRARETEALERRLAAMLATETVRTIPLGAPLPKRDIADELAAAGVDAFGRPAQWVESGGGVRGPGQTRQLAPEGPMSPPTYDRTEALLALAHARARLSALRASDPAPSVVTGALDASWVPGGGQAVMTSERR
jgi:hypothetical protein